MGTDPRIAIEMGTSPRAPPTAILARTIDAPPFRQSPQAPRKRAALSGGQRTVRQWWPRVSVPENCEMIFLVFSLIIFFIVKEIIITVLLPEELFITIT